MSIGTDLIEYWWLVLIACAALLVAGFLALLFIVALFERQHTRVLLPLGDDGPRASDTYARANAEEAKTFGFLRVCSGRPPNSTMANVLVHVMVSPDRRTAAVIGEGRAVGMRVRKTMLISQRGGGRALVTCDEFGTGDLSGLQDFRTLLNADFAELWKAHQSALLQTAQPAEAFSQDVLSDLNRMQSDRARQLFRQGYAAPADVPGHTWRYTAKGAWRIVSVQLVRQTTSDRSQQERYRIARPGS